MMTVETVFRDRYGLHPRAANRIRETAAGFQSRITLEPLEGAAPIDAASMLALVSAAIRTGDRLRVSADGPDEKAALESMTKLFQQGVCHP